MKWDCGTFRDILQRDIENKLTAQTGHLARNFPRETSEFCHPLEAKLAVRFKMRHRTPCRRASICPLRRLVLVSSQMASARISTVEVAVLGKSI